MIILVRACTHRGWTRRQRVGTTFLTRKSSQVFLVLLAGFEPQSYGCLSPTLYQTEPPHHPNTKIQTRLQKLQPGDESLGVQDRVVVLGVHVGLQRDLPARGQVLRLEEHQQTVEVVTLLKQADLQQLQGAEAAGGLALGQELGGRSHEGVVEGQVGVPVLGRNIQVVVLVLPVAGQTRQTCTVGTGEKKLR